MDDLLANSRDLAQETDGCCQNWSNFLAGEPPERNRKKFSYEKLRQAFEEEVSEGATSILNTTVTTAKRTRYCGEVRVGGWDLPGTLVAHPMPLGGGRRL